MHVLASQRVAPRGRPRSDLGWSVTVLVPQRTSSRAYQIAYQARFTWVC